MGLGCTFSYKHIVAVERQLALNMQIKVMVSATHSFEVYKFSGWRFTVECEVSSMYANNIKKTDFNRVEYTCFTN